jgi:hypothetical protein
MNKTFIAALALCLIAAFVYSRNRKVEFEVEFKMEPRNGDTDDDQAEEPDEESETAEPHGAASETHA